MKKSMLALAITMISFSSFSFASDAPVINRNVISSFNKQFQNAKEIKWDTRKNFIRAEFAINNKVSYAYFNHNGDLIAVTRFLSPTQLPTELLSTLKYNTGYWISDLFEIQTETGTSYYVTIENGDQKEVLKSEGNNGWEYFQIIKK